MAINKEITCAWCTYSVNCKNIGMVHIFSSWGGRKTEKEHILRQAKHKEDTAYPLDVKVLSER